MKKVLVVLFVLISYIGYAQPTTTYPFLGTPKSIGRFYGWAQADSGFLNALKDTVLAPIRVGEQRFKTSDSTLYVAISLTADNKWLGLGSGGGTMLDGTGYVKMTGTTPSYNATIPNSDLANSSIAITGNSISLGGSITQDQITGLSSTGLIKRIGANTLTIATSGTDYVSPSQLNDTASAIRSSISSVIDTSSLSSRINTKQDTVQIYGDWVNTTFPGTSLPSGWTVYTISTPTVSNGVVLNASGSSNIAAGFLYMNTNYTGSLNYTQTTDFVLNTTPSVYADGFFVGRRSANGAQQTQNAIVMRMSDATHWRAIIKTLYGSTETKHDSTGTIAMNAGDTIRIYSAWSQTNVYVRIAKLTAGVETETAAAYYKYSSVAADLQQPANTGAVWMGGLGTTGQYKVISYVEKHFDATNANLTIVGNSIGVRYDASSLPSHWSHLAFDKTDLIWNNLSGGGDRFNEFNLRLNEIYSKVRPGGYVLFEGGTNDNYTDMRAQAVPFIDSLKAHGLIPIWLKMFSVTAKDTIAYNICNEEGIQIIDARRSNMNPIGNVHPDDAENQATAYVIQSSIPDITKRTGGNELNIPDVSLISGTTSISGGSDGRFLFDNSGIVDEPSASAMYWDKTNNRLGLGTNVPKSVLDVTGTVRIDGFSLPSTGQALLLSYTGGVGYIYNYNSSGSSYGDVVIGSGGNQVYVKANGNVGIGADPSYKLDIGGTLHTSGEAVLGASLTRKYNSTATGITLDATYDVVEVTTDAQTIILPTAVGISGRTYTIKLTTTGTTTIDGNGTQTIDGSETYTLSAANKYVTVVSNGANWIITANN